jgi:DNA-directed RNA polymerase specialized sigma24 family protein
VARDPAAADRLVREFFPRLVALVRSRTAGRLRARIDDEGVANSALKSFLLRNADDPYELGDWGDTWSLLAEIALCKLAGQVRRHTRQARDLSREQPIDGFDVADRQPGPEDAVVVEDLLDWLSAGRSPVERAVVELSLHGYPVREVAEALGLSERTVIRLRVAFQKRLEIERLRDTGPA